MALSQKGKRIVIQDPRAFAATNGHKGAWNIDLHNGKRPKNPRPNPATLSVRFLVRLPLGEGLIKSRSVIGPRPPRPAQLRNRAGIHVF
jgi:hypothetical protein